MIANAIRQEIRTRSDEQNTEVTVASWFMMKSELSEEGDLSLKEEMDYCKLVQNGNYDIVFADENTHSLEGFRLPSTTLPSRSRITTSSGVVEK